MPERIAHVLALIISTLGTILVGVTIDDDLFGGSTASLTGSTKTVVFAFCVGTSVSLLLLLNSSRDFPTFIPITFAMAYYWFPKGVALADYWNTSLDDATGDEKDNLQRLLAGAVLTLIGTASSVLVEFFFPKFTSSKSDILMTILAFIAFLFTLAGLLAVWIMCNHDFSEYYTIEMLSVQAILSAVLALDSCLFPDTTVLFVSLFMCLYTGCALIDIGGSYGVASNSDDLEKTKIGCLVAGIGLGSLCVCVTILAIGRQKATQ